MGGFFGFSVAASGPEAVVGDPGDMGGAGRAFVFSSASGGWGQTAELAGRDTQAGDNFGFSVAERAGQVLVGAPWHRAGAAYVFSASVGGWRQSAEISGGARPGEEFGWSVALGPGLVAVGAPGQEAGRAYLFSQARFGLAPERRALRALGSRRLLRHRHRSVGYGRSNRRQRMARRYGCGLGHHHFVSRY